MGHTEEGEHCQISNKQYVGRKQTNKQTNFLSLDVYGVGQGLQTDGHPGIGPQFEKHEKRDLNANCQSTFQTAVKMTVVS